MGYLHVIYTRFFKALKLKVYIEFLIVIEASIIRIVHAQEPMTWFMGSCHSLVAQWGFFRLNKCIVCRLYIE